LAKLKEQVWTTSLKLKEQYSALHTHSSWWGSEYKNTCMKHVAWLWLNGFLWKVCRFSLNFGPESNAAPVDISTAVL
jgi:hypothetical protein